MWKRIALFTLGLFLVIAFGYKTVQAQVPPIVPIPISLSAENYGSTYIPEGLDQSDNPTDRAIVGDDDRLPIKYQGYFPWSAIGRIDWVRNDGQDVGACSGTLIDRDLVLTNSHCLFYRGVPIPQIVFKPNLVQGIFTEDDQATVIERVFGWEESSSDSEDWALLRIDKPLGDTYGYLGWRQLDLADPSVLSALQNQVRLAGYSGDYPSRQQRADYDLGGIEMETAGIHMGCNIEGSSEGLKINYDSRGEGRFVASGEPVAEGLIIHTCDTTGGASGSALLAKFDDENYYIIGLHAGLNSFDESTIPEGRSRDICKVTRYNDNGELLYNSNDELVYDESFGICRNRGVQVSRWASQASALREEG